MIVAILTAMLQQGTAPAASPTESAPSPSSLASPSAEPNTTAPKVARSRPIETVELGTEQSVTGHILKETGDALFVDVGFDVIRIPLAAILRRVPQGLGTKTGNVADEGIFARAERPEESIAEGSTEVGPAVVKIESPSGQGSGFLVNAGGHVVTNFHVVNGEVEVDVKLFLRRDGALEQRTLRKVKVVAANPAMDLALLKIDPPEDLDLPFVYLGDSESMGVGDRVYAIGTPIGLERTVSSGIVSVTNRSFGGRTHLQITTPINPGNSGGPLFNLRGEVVGVNSSGYTGLQGLNFAIPSKYVMDFLRNRDAFAVDTTRSENGIHYLPAPRKPIREPSQGSLQDSGRE